MIVSFILSDTTRPERVCLFGVNEFFCAVLFCMNYLLTLLLTSFVCIFTDSFILPDSLRTLIESSVIMRAMSLRRVLPSFTFLILLPVEPKRKPRICSRFSAISFVKSPAVLSLYSFILVIFVRIISVSVYDLCFNRNLCTRLSQCLLCYLIINSVNFKENATRFDWSHKSNWVAFTLPKFDFSGLLGKWSVGKNAHPNLSRFRSVTSHDLSSGFNFI